MAATMSSYVPELGSYYQLVAVYSDMPCPGDDWGEPRVLERCGRCQVCLQRCPTGAVGADRFLLHVERCLTLHNERPAGVPFPGWIDPAWHHALIGCHLCQRDCPENRMARDRPGGTERFSGEETALLLAPEGPDALPAETQAKLARLDTLGRLPIVRRNLPRPARRRGPAGSNCYAHGRRLLSLARSAATTAGPVGSGASPDPSGASSIGVPAARAGPGVPFRGKASLQHRRTLCVTRVRRPGVG